VRGNAHSCTCGRRPVETLGRSSCAHTAAAPRCLRFHSSTRVCKMHVARDDQSAFNRELGAHLKAHKKFCTLIHMSAKCARLCWSQLCARSRCARTRCVVRAHTVRLPANLGAILFIFLKTDSLIDSYSNLLNNTV
jgi:hypothetical protein